jgi:hypothetical protein
MAGSRMTDTGAAFRLEARSAKGLSSSINGDPRNGDTDPKPAEAAEKSPRGGDDMVYSPWPLVAADGDKEVYCAVKLVVDGEGWTRQFPQRQDEWHT